MPAQQKYPTPAQGMRAHLETSLPYGIPFDKAWEAGLGAIRYPHALEEREQWEVALEWAKPAFRASYECELDEFERVFSALNPANGPIELQAVA